jgi:glycosyltransferase involved in cell wall biosynthesis
MKRTGNRKSKPRVALFAKGVIGGGNLGYGIPVLRELFQKLSKHYDIVLYSFSSIDESTALEGIQVRQIKWRLPDRLKFLLLTIRFITDHIFHSFTLLFAVSVFPAGYWAIVAGKIVNRPVVVQLIGLEAVALPDINQGNLISPKLKVVTEEVCKRADKLIVVADYQKMIAEHSLSATREMFVLPLRIDYRKFMCRQRRISFPVQFIHIAYYSPVKDQDTMFATFAKVASIIDCHLKVIGDGYNVPKVHTMMSQLNIDNKVTFIGEIDQSEIPEHFADAHILLHTARFETGCAVIQEAMASGVAVCGTRVGILSDIGDEYAVISDPAAADELASKILQLVNNAKAYEEMTKRAQQWITTYDSVWSYQNYTQFLNKIILEKDQA